MEVTVAFRFEVADAQLQIVLVLAILLTMLVGFEEGTVWAFVGGLLVDIMALRPLGTTAFAMLLAVGIVTAAAPLLARARVFDAVVGVFLLTPIFLLVSLVASGFLRPPAPAFSITGLVAAAFLNALLAALLTPPVRAIGRRVNRRERLVW
jgi:rod shape-determining protein MreD